jgi:rhomboid protease GluP
MSPEEPVDTPALPAVRVTPAIVAANILVFGLMVARGVPPLGPTAEDLFNWGATFGPAVALDGEWWRLLTSAFVHVGAIHIALNMYVLWGAGPLTERIYGHAAFLVLYVLAAIGGSLASVLWSPLAVSAGASGAIFGVYGALLAFTHAAHHALPPPVVASLRRGIIMFVVYNIIFGLTIPNISNSAHLGGFATGFAAGWLLARGPGTPRQAPARRLARCVPLLLVLAVLAWAAHRRVAALPEVVSKTATR